MNATKILHSGHDEDNNLTPTRANARFPFHQWTLCVRPGGLYSEPAREDS